MSSSDYAGLSAEDFAEPQMLADARLGAALRAALAEVEQGEGVLKITWDGRVWEQAGPKLRTWDATERLAATLHPPEPEAPNA